MLVLLDLENLSFHGLEGIEGLKKTDKIVTFYGKDNFLPKKLTNIMKESPCEFEIQEGFVGTKNAADYQLIAYLTSAIVKDLDTDFLVLSRDNGFDISLNYLRDKYPEKNIIRKDSIFQYFILDFFEKEFGLNSLNALSLYQSLLYYKPKNVSEFRALIIKIDLRDKLLELLPYLNVFGEVLNFNQERDCKLDKSTIKMIEGLLNNAKTPQDTYNAISLILGIDLTKNYSNIKSLRRYILNSTDIKNLEHKITSNTNLLNLEGFKRSNLIPAIKPFYKILKKAIASKG